MDKEGKMAKAYKCDRCGKLFALNINKGILTQRRRIEIVIDYHPMGEERMDLCDDCYKGLLSYMSAFRTCDASIKRVIDTESDKTIEEE